MNVLFNDNKMLIEDDELVPKLERIHEYWPKLLDEYLSMIVRNRERQLERIVVTEEIRSRARDKARDNLAKELDNDRIEKR